MLNKTYPKSIYSSEIRSRPCSVLLVVIDRKRNLKRRKKVGRSPISCHVIKHHFIFEENVFFNSAKSHSCCVRGPRTWKFLKSCISRIYIWSTCHLECQWLVPSSFLGVFVTARSHARMTQPLENEMVQNFSFCWFLILLKLIKFLRLNEITLVDSDKVIILNLIVFVKC